MFTKKSIAWASKASTVFAHVSVGFAVTLSVVLAMSAFGADGVVCNTKQTRCVVETKDLTIGDNVGFFSEREELVAVGIVKGMQGRRRAIEVTESNGKIRSDVRLSLFAHEGEGSVVATSFKKYSEPSAVAVGGSFGLASVSIGEGSPASDFQILGSWRNAASGNRWMSSIDWVGRLTHLGAEGEATTSQGVGAGTRTDSVSARGFGLLAGPSYTWRNARPILFRAELAAGLMHMTGNVGGNSSAIESGGYKTNIHNGFGAYVRAEGAIAYQFDPMSIDLIVAQSMIHQASMSTLGLGLRYAIK